MSFDTKQIQSIAKLARLNLSDGDREKFAGEIDGILNWVEQLNGVDITGIEPLTSVTAETNRMRADVVTDGNIQAELTANAPESVMGFYVVPKMVE